MFGVATEHGILQVSRADQVVRRERNASSSHPSWRPTTSASPGLERARGRAEQHVEHGHEVALAGAEAAVKVCGL